MGIGLNAVDYFLVVPRFPESGGKIEVDSHEVMTGGQTATALSALTRLGYSTRYLGYVGDDEAGRIQIESLQAAGVDISRLKVIEGGLSPVSVIIVERGSGERTILWRKGVAAGIDPAEVDESFVSCGRVLLIDGHSIAAETKAARFAKAAGLPVVIDVDKDYGGEGLYRLVDYLITASEFPSRITGLSDERAALAALHEKYGNSVVAMTLGSKGALAYCDGTYVEAPGFSIEAYDTTGAGDAFHGGFIFGMLEGHSLEETLRVANAVAAMNCMKLGARGGLPTRAELAKFLNSQ